MSKKKKSGQSMAQAAADGNPVAVIGMKLTTPAQEAQATTLAANAKTKTLLSRPERSRGFFSAQANTARKTLLGA